MALPEYRYQRLRFESMIQNCAVYPRALYERTSGHSEAMKHGFEDWQLYVRLWMPRPGLSDRCAAVRLCGGHDCESLTTIYRDNAVAYSDVVADPISSSMTARQLLLPDVARRYKH